MWSSFESALANTRARQAEVQPDPKISQELRKNVSNHGDLILNEAINQVDKAFTVLEEYRQSDTPTDAGLQQLTDNYKRAVDNLKQTYRNTRGSNVGGGLRLSDMIMGYHIGSDPYSVTGGADAAMDALNLHPRVKQPSRTNTGETTLFNNEEVKPVEEAGNTEKPQLVVRHVVN